MLGPCQASIFLTYVFLCGSSDNTIHVLCNGLAFVYSVVVLLLFATSLAIPSRRVLFCLILNLMSGTEDMAWELGAKGEHLPFLDSRQVTP